MELVILNIKFACVSTSVLEKTRMNNNNNESNGYTRSHQFNFYTLNM